MGKNMNWGQEVDRIESVLMGHTPHLLGFGDARRTAVLVTIQPGPSGELQVLFEHRSKTLRRQPGEISFPGGHVEPGDSNEAETAVREASEELGIQTSDIRLLGPLDVFIASSNLLVFPYVGVLPQGLPLHPNEDEVAEVFRIDYERLLRFEPAVYDVKLAPQFPDDFPFHLVPKGRDYSFRTVLQRYFFFHMDGWVIWGLTARILNHFLDLMRRDIGRGLHQRIVASDKTGQPGS